MRTLSTPITLIVLLGLLAAGAIWGYKAVTAKVPVTPPPPCVTLPMTDLLTSSVTVNVYNGGTTRGLASSVSEALKQGGFLIGKVDNTDERTYGATIVGAAADNPEVQLAAAWFVNPQIRADDRPDHSVDVLLGADFVQATGMIIPGPASVALPSGEVCLPASATPTPVADAAQPTDAAAQPTDTPT
jgi:hypothetical protein